MCMATGTLLLWAVTTAHGLSTSLNCAHLTPHEIPLQQFGNCSVTLENGYINALCNIELGLPRNGTHIPAGPKTVAVECLLVSVEPLRWEPREGEIVCLSLRSLKIRKWDTVTLEDIQQYFPTATQEERLLDAFNPNSMNVLVRQMSFKSTFSEPAVAARAVCKGATADRSCNFNVYGFNRHNRYYSGMFELVENIFPFFQLRNIPSVRIEVLNVTFADTVKNIPRSWLYSVAVAPMKHLLFYKCNFDSINKPDIPNIEGLEHLEFFQTPIREVDPHVFKLNPNFTHSSFIGTNLPGIPEAIFDLSRLHTLDMSDTNVPDDTEFEYCPGNCQRESTVKQVILIGTNLSSLPNRAFCGFPLLNALDLTNCHIAQLLGSPFECLQNLTNLTMPRNKIRSLDGKSMEGLKNLDFLDLSENCIAHFEGPQIFSKLRSLRTLILFQNVIEDLQLGAVEQVPIQQLNLAYNQISRWKPPLFIRMRKLEILLLEHNVISGLSEDMLHDISHVKYVNLSWNPWNCCQLKNLRSVLEKHPSQCANCFICKKPDEYEGRFVIEVPLNEDACDPPDHFRIFGVPAVLSIMIVSLAGYAVYRNRWFCSYCLLYLKLAMKGRRRQAQAGRFLWDGFLSYHASDAEWVREVLLPKLESDPMRFRLCVSERDFIPGFLIAENICRAIALSRVSLFLLSREFCRSRWCMFELNLAQHRLFESDRHGSMVFIRKSDVEVSEMSSTLMSLINSRTNVELPPDGSSEVLNNLFWLQVQAALEK